MNQNRLAGGRDKEKDKSLELKKQISTKQGENNNINSKQSDKQIAKIINNQDKNCKPQELKREKSDVSTQPNGDDITTSTEATCNSDNLNMIRKRESDKKDLKNIENFFDKKKENLNRYFYKFIILFLENPNQFLQTI